MRPFRCLLRVALVVITTFPAASQEYPTRGFVTSVDENSGLMFECAGQALTASCSFVQTMVSQEKPATAAEIDAQVTELLGDEAGKSMCGELLQQFEVVRNGGDFGVELTLRDRTDAINYADLLEAYCTQTTSENAGALVEYVEQRKARTCKIGTFPFDLSFNWNSASQRWESVSAPEGACGVVTMSFMEKDKGYSYFWNYREQTIVTNKVVSDPIRGDCSAWPEGEQYYKWQPDTLKRSCEYLSFGF